MPAVRRRRGAGVGRLDVAQLARRALEGDALPHDLPGRRVEREQRPPLRRAIGRRIAVAVESGPERRLRIAADGARHEDAIAPHDRARVREAGDRRPPAHVLARLRVPGVRQVLAVRHAGRLRRRGTTASCPWRARTASRAAGPARVTVICRGATATVSDARRHELRSRIMRRVWQGSAISANVGCPSAAATR